ncbi:dethiobiotin synthase [Candidatus Scalindua japonica]|uniref:ATP-dependent dethiobiotin synthetase BioD n=1 Tax=Candidatus Scalindua japonica TaxID=1284222 RepID=A0A286TYB3_9BACT|nr:dethiobiotin synthase [Candidatus Scalindua japonica]GAX60856.1 dethiobiotin synthase [Candidatus Scalindua japonica]
MEKGVFVTGSNTGVGKTVIAAAIAASIKAHGLSVGVMKPVASGAKESCGKLISEDAVYLKKIIDSTDDDAIVNPILLKPPIAPTIAASQSGVSINIDKIWRAYEALSNKHDFVVVEGVGGLMVPIDDTHFVADLAHKMDLALIIVSGDYLGTINHTLLTVEYARNRNLRIKGIVINMLKNSDDFVREIEKYSSVPILGTIPFKENVSVEDCVYGDIVEDFRREINVSTIMRKET